MKKYFLVLLVLSVVLSLGIVPAGAAGEPPMFLLGQNEKAEVVLSPGGVISLELGKNPLQVITGSKGEKIILCAGESEKTGEIKQGASLRVLTRDLKAYATNFQCDSSLTGYVLNKDRNIIWLATRGGNTNKTVVKPKIYQINLDSLAVTEVVLDSIPCEIALSGDNKWLAVPCLGDAGKPTSVLNLFEADTMKPVISFDIAKNPGMLSFSDDDASLVVVGYGYSEGFTIPTGYSINLTQTTPAGANIIDLASLQNKQMDLGTVNQELVAGSNATVYCIAKEESSGTVKAVGPMGLFWEKKCDYVPQYVQERPGTNQIFIIGGKKMSIIEKQNGKPIKEITAGNDLKPFTFLENSLYAYAYNMNNRKLNILNTEKLEIEKTMAAGSTGLAVMKSMAVVASYVNYYNSLQPQYVNGVRMPTQVSQIYWVHAPKGNIVACPEQKKLFMLNSFLAEIYTYDLQKGVVDKKLGYLGEKTMYLQMAPNGKYVVLVSGDNWKLVNVETDKADLTFNPSGVKISLAFSAVSAPTPYYSPDGNKMYIPNGSKITVIDLQKGEKLDVMNTQTKDAMIYW